MLGNYELNRKKTIAGINRSFSTTAKRGRMLQSGF